MNKSIVTCVILTIIPCGLYGIYWMYCINEAACQINPAEWYTSFGLVVLFTILTCGIYGLYWNYKIGKALAAAPGGADNSVLYLVLSLFQFDIVNWCIMQSDINRAYPI